MKCKIGELRRNKGLSQKWIAQQVGMSPENLSRIEKNKIEPRAFLLWEIAELLDCRVDDLYTKEKSPTQQE